jgi:hypothetical protein
MPEITVTQHKPERVRKSGGMKVKTYSKNMLSILLGALLLGVVGTAAAQWQVVDNQQIRENGTNTGKITENADSNRQKITDKLNDIYVSNKLGTTPSGDKPSGDEVENPKEALAKVADDYGVASCAGQTNGTPVAAKQKATCELMQRTRNSQYNYMVAMHEITKKRLERLRVIEKERNQVQDTQIGKLEDNTNKLIALKTLMDIDRQQMESAMFAYETRLNYLTQQQTNQAKTAMTGKEVDDTGGGGAFGNVTGDLTSLAGQVAAGMVMKGVLEALKSQSQSTQKMRKLSID